MIISTMFTIAVVSFPIITTTNHHGITTMTTNTIMTTVPTRLGRGGSRVTSNQSFASMPKQNIELSLPRNKHNSLLKKVCTTAESPPLPSPSLPPPALETCCCPPSLSSDTFISVTGVEVIFESSSVHTKNQDFLRRHATMTCTKEALPVRPA